jgi:hypothetical protein
VEIKAGIQGTFKKGEVFLSMKIRSFFAFAFDSLDG